jgi:hypothetical protein
MRATRRSARACSVSTALHRRPGRLALSCGLPGRARSLQDAHVPAISRRPIPEAKAVLICSHASADIWRRMFIFYGTYDSYCRNNLHRILITLLGVAPGPCPKGLESSSAVLPGKMVPFGHSPRRNFLKYSVNLGGCMRSASRAPGRQQVRAPAHVEPTSAGAV